MRKSIHLLIASAAIFVVTNAVVKATYIVYAPNYPTLTQLESGWNAAFISWLTDEYGVSPIITSTTTYAGQEGQVFVVSSYNVGSMNGKILGRAFDPQEATSLGSGSYHYQVQANGAFKCNDIDGCLCDPYERHYPDGHIERGCNCELPGLSCEFAPTNNFTGSYQIRPSDYTSLPVLN